MSKAVIFVLIFLGCKELPPEKVLVKTYYRVEGKDTARLFINTLFDTAKYGNHGLLFDPEKDSTWIEY